MTAEPYTAIGRVVKTHGLKGEVSVVPATEAPLFVLEGTAVWLVPPPAQLRTSRIASVRPGPKGPVVTLDGVKDINAARALVGAELLALTDSLPAEWFDTEDEIDATGWTVTDVERGLLGEVDEVLITGANDVWIVHGPFGEVLIPVIDDVIIDFDEDTGTATVRLLEGLLPGEGEEA